MPRQVISYANCGKCLAELPDGESAQDYARLNLGFTAEGLRLECVRHGVAVFDLTYDAVQGLGEGIAKGNISACSIKGCKHKHH